MPILIFGTLSPISSSSGTHSFPPPLRLLMDEYSLYKTWDLRVKLSMKRRLLETLNEKFVLEEQVRDMKRLNELIWSKYSSPVYLQ